MRKMKHIVHVSLRNDGSNRQVMVIQLMISMCLLSFWLASPFLIPTVYATTTCFARQVGRNILGTATGYTLEVDLLAFYDANRNFCGQMQASASFSNPPHGTGGSLQIHLTNCEMQDLATASLFGIPTGGLYGVSGVTQQTSMISTDCSSASALFLDGEAMNMRLSVATDAVYGKYALSSEKLQIGNGS